MENLEQENFETKLLDWIRIIALDEKTGKLDKSKIKEKVGYFVAEFDKDSPISKELLDNYDEIFDKQYKKYLDLNKGEVILSNYINKYLENELMNNKNTIKDEIKKIIQTFDPLCASKMEFDVEIILENYDKIFDWAYEQKKAKLLPKEESIKQEVERNLEEAKKSMKTIKEKREVFIASIKPKANNKQKDDLKKDKEKKDRGEEVSYTTIRGKDITFHNIGKKNKENGKKEIKIMKFMNRENRITQFSQNNDPQTKTWKDGDDDERCQK